MTQLNFHIQATFSTSKHFPIVFSLHLTTELVPLYGFWTNFGSAPYDIVYIGW